MKFRKSLLLVFGIAVIALVFYQFVFPKTPVVQGEEYHAHADFAVFINGEKIDFAKEEFMSDVSCGKPPELIDLNDPSNYPHVVHLHDLNGNVIHFHHANATLSIFFKSIGFDLTNECFATLEARYCNTQSKRLKVFANGLQVMDMEKFVPQDVDKILVTYGEESSSEVRAQNEFITNQACIYSEKCPVPEGFVLPQEACV